PGRHVGKRGEDVKPRSVVLKKGRVLRPQDLGLLAALGKADVPVIRRPCVNILISGDELLPMGSRPEGCRIVDSNSVMLAALVKRDGGRVEQVRMVPDRREGVRQAVLEAQADVLLLSAASSVGQADQAPEGLAEAGAVA